MTSEEHEYQQCEISRLARERRKAGQRRDARGGIVFLLLALTVLALIFNLLHN